MNRRPHNWVLIVSTSLAIGSFSAIAEKLLGQRIDALLPEATKVSNFSRPGTITFLSTNGKIIQKIGPATREKVAKGTIPKLAKQAFIAAEDRRFYEHNGVDLWGVSRALINNLKKGSVTEGGSTITQQLARTVFLSQDRTLTRKLKEAALAYKLERQLSKDEILEEYLNNVYLGSGAYGIADAAWIYFRKDPNSLSLEEIALIAGLAPAPSFYSPLVNPEIALERRSLVLIKMLKEGFISKKLFDEAYIKPLDLKPAQPKYFNSSAPFFTSWVAHKLPTLLTPEQIEIGGLKVQTSLNLEWQKKAQKVINEYSPEDMEGALVAIENSSGLVRALIGGKDFRSNQFNRATQAFRSPGSTFKIFPYSAALNLGIKPTDIFLDMPSCWDDYCPRNFGNKYRGRLSLTDAFRHSSNTIAVQILKKVGFSEVITTANKLGIGNNRKLGKYYPLAIGAYEQTVLDMTAAYAGVANRGFFIYPSPFERILGPDNEILWSNKDNIKAGIQALNRETADTMNWMLKKAVEDGTGTAASLQGREVAGKTGTSEGSRDLWFIGSIPQLTIGIWFGYDDNRKTKSSSGEAAYAWKQFLLSIDNELEILQFKK